MSLEEDFFRETGRIKGMADAAGSDLYADQIDEEFDRIYAGESDPQ
ncbi:MULTISPECIES: hypothetical protein [unclassified Brevibacterium]|nr:MULTISPECIES: hypothetical protein [unclassified Brevibacterium]MDK8434295.1 hypothetical protein [Brevibacterium sp. H-BE7]